MKRFIPGLPPPPLFFRFDLIRSKTLGNIFWLEPLKVTRSRSQMDKRVDQNVESRPPIKARTNPFANSMTL